MVAESMCLICMLYITIAGVYYGYNIKMGSWWTGIIMSAFWPVVAIMWVAYFILTAMEVAIEKRVANRRKG